MTTALSFTSQSMCFFYRKWSIIIRRPRSHLPVTKPIRVQGSCPSSVLRNIFNQRGILFFDEKDEPSVSFIQNRVKRYSSTGQVQVDRHRVHTIRTRNHYQVTNTSYHSASELKFSHGPPESAELHSSALAGTSPAWEVLLLLNSHSQRHVPQLGSHLVFLCEAPSSQQLCTHPASYSISFPENKSGSSFFTRTIRLQ
jgi:hypothetical protein